LSLQIHPSDADTALGPHESGKPEAWYIIDADADADAGLYLGFREGVSRQDIARAIENEERVDRLMHFVLVSPGDLFLIEPGTPHAIGKGVFLLEPQRVAPGKRGITYRYWDWNRRYDPSGRPDAHGKPRALHVERALDVTDWEGPRGQALVDRIRYPSGAPPIDDSASLETLTSPTGPLCSDSFFLRRLAGSGLVELPSEDRLRGLTVLEGTLTLDDGEATMKLGRGQTAALPAALDVLSVELEAAHAMLCTLA
jgi:mannose-6-phosphate isomerase class I